MKTVVIILKIDIYVFLIDIYVLSHRLNIASNKHIYPQTLFNSVKLEKEIAKDYITNWEDYQVLDRGEPVSNKNYFLSSIIEIYNALCSIPMKVNFFSKIKIIFALSKLNKAKRQLGNIIGEPNVYDYIPFSEE